MDTTDRHHADEGVALPVGQPAGPIGFVGLGHMGEPMATRLVRSGADVLVWNRSRPKVDQLAASGATAAASVDEVFARCRVVVLMLANGPVTDEVLRRDHTGFGVQLAGRTVVNTGTVSPAYAVGLRDDVVRAGGRYVEAPVSGSRVPAQEGQLVAMVAGDDPAVAEVEPLLAPMTAARFRCGAVPRGTETKLAVNVFLIGMVTALAEAVHFAEHRSTDVAVLREILDAGPMASAVSRVKLSKLADADFSPQASITDVLCNNRLILTAAAERQIPMPLLAVCGELYADTEDLGLGRQDMAAVIEAIRARTSD